MFERARAGPEALKEQMATIVFRCPKSRQLVQLTAEEASHGTEGSYLPWSCPACGKTHFVNRSTHKLLGHEDE